MILVSDMQHLYNLGSGHPGKSSTRVTPKTVITISSTILSVLHSTPPYYSVTANLSILASFPFTHSPNLPPMRQSSKCSLHLQICFCSVRFDFLDSICKWSHLASLFLCLTYFTQHKILWVFLLAKWGWDSAHLERCGPHAPSIPLRPNKSPSFLRSDFHGNVIVSSSHQPCWDLQCVTGHIMCRGFFPEYIWFW